jgi:hypothetical protein
MSLFDKYLPAINSAIAQKGQAQSNMWKQGGQDVSQLLMGLAKILQENQFKTDDQNLQSQYPIMQDKSFTVGDIPRPNTVVSTDLLGKPLTQSVTNRGYGGAPVSYERPTPVEIPQMQGSVNVPPQFMLQNLFAQMNSGGSNPVTQSRLNNVAKMPEIAKAFSNQTKEFDPTKDRVETDWMGNPIGETKGKPKEKISTGFAEFLSANADKYSNMPNGLSTAYSDYQAQGMEQFKKKEETKAGLRAQKDGKKISEYASDDGFKTIIWKNPDNSIVEIKSREKMMEKPESATLQKQDAQLSSLLELADRVGQSAKPEYLGGFVSGVSGQGMGGLTGGVREATGLIDADEVEFRSNVASISDQLRKSTRRNIKDC